MSPVASIMGAHVHGTPSFSDVGAELRAGVSQEVVVWRQGLRPQFRQALPGEVDLLQHLMTGATSKQIARVLDISPRTVEAHRARLMRKYGAATQGELLSRLIGGR